MTRSPSFSRSSSSRTMTILPSADVGDRRLDRIHRAAVAGEPGRQLGQRGRQAPGSTCTTARGGRSGGTRWRLRSVRSARRARRRYKPAASIADRSSAAKSSIPLKTAPERRNSGTRSSNSELQKKNETPLPLSKTATVAPRGGALRQLARPDDPLPATHRRGRRPRSRRGDSPGQVGAQPGRESMYRPVVDRVRFVKSVLIRPKRPRCHTGRALTVGGCPMRGYETTSR